MPRVGRAPKGPSGPEELPCPERTGLTPKKTPCIKKPPCPEGAKQVSPGQSEAAQPPSAALGKRPTPHVRRPEGARQMRHKREKPSIEMIRMPTSRRTWLIRFARRSPRIQAIHCTSGSKLLVITSRYRSCRAPSGRCILEGFVTQGDASRLRRDALPWAILSLPLRCVRIVGSRRRGPEEPPTPQKPAMRQETALPRRGKTG